MTKLKDTDPQPVTAGDLRPGSNAMMQLLSFVERHERLQEERDALGADQREVMEEAKGMGFDTKILRTVIRRRKMDAADRQEADAMLELYEDSVRQAEKQQVDTSVKEGAGPAESPAAPAPRRGWGARAAQAQAAEPVAEPNKDEVEATAAAEIGHAADHPEQDDGPRIPSFLRRT